MTDRFELGGRHFARIAADQAFAIGFVAGGARLFELRRRQAGNLLPGPHFAPALPAVPGGGGVEDHWRHCLSLLKADNFTPGGGMRKIAAV
jgi:hypothetical protein